MSLITETAPFYTPDANEQLLQEVGTYYTAAYFTATPGQLAQSSYEVSAQELADRYSNYGVTPADSLPEVGAMLAAYPSSSIYETLERESQAALQEVWETDHLVQSYGETDLTPVSNLPEVGAIPEPPVLPDYRVVFSLSEAAAAGKLHQPETDNSPQVHISTQRQDPRLQAVTYDRRPGVSWQDVETETGERISVAQIQAEMALAPTNDVNHLLRVRDSLVKSREWDLRDEIPQAEIPQTTNFDVSPQQQSIVPPSHTIAEITPKVEEMRVEIAQEAIDDNPVGVCRALFKTLGLKMRLRRSKLGKVERDDQGQVQREVVDQTGTVVTEAFIMPPKPTLESERHEMRAYDNATRGVIGKIALGLSKIVSIKPRKLDPLAHEMMLKRIRGYVA